MISERFLILEMVEIDVFYISFNKKNVSLNFSEYLKTSRNPRLGFGKNNILLILIVTFFGTLSFHGTNIVVNHLSGFSFGVAQEDILDSRTNLCYNSWLSLR